LYCTENKEPTPLKWKELGADMCIPLGKSIRELNYLGNLTQFMPRDLSLAAFYEKQNFVHKYYEKRKFYSTFQSLWKF
jgi:hypothetical protein